MRTQRKRLVAGLFEGLLLLGSVRLAAQAVHAPEVRIGPEAAIGTDLGITRLTTIPFWDESERLERLYGKVVTYEDPVWQWSGDMEPFGRSFQIKSLPFVRPPDSGDDPEPILARTLDAYHRQTDGPQFKVITSRWGLHIVPAQVRDENGRWAAAKNPLDAKITVPVEERSAQEHISAILSQVSAVSGTKVDLFLPYLHLGRYYAGEVRLRDDFDDHFGAYPVRFQWGTSSTVARDAIIDLLNLSATTFTWRLGCGLKTNRCMFNLEEFLLSVAKPDGSRTNRMVLYDRCGACERLKNRPDTSFVVEFAPVAPH